MSQTHLTVPALLAISLACSAHGGSGDQLVPIGGQQTLTGSASVTIDGLPVVHEFDAIGQSGFDPFDESLTVTASHVFDGGEATTTTTSTQQSLFADTAILAAGSAAIELTSPPGAGNSGEGISFFGTTFDVIDGPLDLTLTGFASAEPLPTPPGHASVTIILKHQSGPGVFSATATPGSPLELDEAITLEPDRYTLTVFADVVLIHDESRGSESSEVEFNIALSVAPTPGDLDGDGAVGPIDLAQLLDAWGECDDPGAPGGCPADLNGDGDVGPVDLALLLDSWT